MITVILAIMAMIVALTGASVAALIYLNVRGNRIASDRIRAERLTTPAIQGNYRPGYYLDGTVAGAMKEISFR